MSSRTLPSTPLSLRPALALSVLSGFLYFLAFPGVDLWPLAFVCWAPLLIACEGQTPKRALLLGWVHGLTSVCCGFRFLLATLQTFAGFPMIVCVGIFLILAAYQALSFGTIAFLYGRARAKGWPAGLVFALSIAASEQAFPLLFPYYAGAQLHTTPRLIQIVDLGGPIAASVALSGGSVALAELLIARMQARAIAPRRVVLALLGPAILVVYGSLRLSKVDRAIAAAPSAKVAIIQGNMSLGATDRADGDGATVHRDLQFELEKTTPLDLAVWPEGAINYNLRAEDLASGFQRFVLQGMGHGTFEQLRSPVLAGHLTARGHDGQGHRKFYNSASLVTPAPPQPFTKGLATPRELPKVWGTYDKNWREMFGEFLPFGEELPVLYKISPMSGHLQPGENYDPIRYGEHAITTLICYEDILPGFTNRSVSKGDPDLIVNLTNDAWFLDSKEPAIHLALSELRAVEHHRYMVRATNSGISAFIDAAGRSSGQTQLFKRTTTVGDVRWMRGRTVYEVLGDAPWWLATIVVVAMGWIDRKRLPFA